jgi:lysylphosphatidylglycerol synthetase-like protein (DUF2156 family)
MNESQPKSLLAHFVLRATRVALPLLIAAFGVALIVLGATTGGATSTHSRSGVIAATGVALVVAAIIVWMLNWMYRMSVTSNREREEEEAARDYFDLHGHWPEEGAG